MLGALRHTAPLTGVNSAGVPAIRDGDADRDPFEAGPNTAQHSCHPATLTHPSE